MSVTIKINHYSKEILSNPILCYYTDFFKLNTPVPFYKGSYQINIIIKNIYEYMLDDIDKTLEIKQINNKNYYYTKIFTLDINQVSIYIINKNNKEKIRNIIKFKKIYPLCLYSYFIYNKYYSRYNNKKKIYANVFIDIDTINEIKLFNCRDLYKIYSFI